jgi:hypothetical protein
MGEPIHLNKNLRRPVFAGALMSLALVGAACGASAAAPQDEPAPTAIPEHNIQEEHQPTATPTLVVNHVPPVETPVPADEPAEDVAPIEAPRVLWMRTSHAGPGVVTVRFETSVPTTAKVMAMTNQVGPASFFSEDLNELATVHTTSVPASAFGRYQVRVENENGDVARAEMRYKSDPMGLDWGTGAAAPMLKAPNSKQLDVTYAFPANHTSKLGFDGTVHVFMTDADCTTADACEGELVGSPLEAPATGNAQLESHEAIAAIPGSAFDYQVIVGQPLNEDSSMMVFLQLEIRGDELPKVKFDGPKVIKN